MTRNRIAPRLGLLVGSTLVACSLVPLGTAAAGADDGAASAANGGGTGSATTAPRLSFADPTTEATFGPAYQAALKNLLVTNTVPFDDATYNQSGLMTADPATFVKAGGGYPQPWTRDASVNSWNAASLLEPEVARNTLWSAVDKDDQGRLQVKQDDQTWDQVVWVTSAWNHYLVTGDRSFLADAFQTAKNTLAIRLANSDPGLNPDFGLFTGPSFFNDGVAGYPAPPADPTESLGSGSFSYPGIRAGMFLSTNELYYAAFENAANMARALGRPASEVTGYLSRAATLKATINARFWNPKTGLYRYFVLPDGTTGDYQEGTGLAFAILFGIADERQTRSILKNTHLMDEGVADVYPDFERYSTDQPGRHNAIVWPVVEGFWGSAAAQGGDQTAFATNLAGLAHQADANSGFWEIYNGSTGVVDGGYQRLGDDLTFHWGSQPDQTWSATAYLRQIYDGVFGIGYTEHGLELTPTLPMGWGDVTLSDLRYRDANLTVRLHGAGDRIASVRLDGRHRASAEIPANLRGRHVVDVTLVGGTNGDRDDDGLEDRADRCPDQAGTHALQGCPASQRIQAEDALNEGGVKTNVNHTGYDGKAFVDGVWSTGASSTYRLNLRPARSTGTLTVRYANANGADATLSLYVDGTRVRQLSLPANDDGSWDTWSTFRLPALTLHGQHPTVSLRMDDGDSGRVNLDWVGFGS
ncbi:MGH1-like glycoside hydrolase domain-containing protein [Luteimicrobium sp. DT211]|uniref:MGH1-like glycoside hydrolase domain-containing protein n=1 Tax=Luteimicrobium sp. DT211 TaxID=3393412 RepID=UPI003CE7CAC8